MKMRLSEMKDTILSQNYEMDELCTLLEIDQYQLLEKFPDNVVENGWKFGIIGACVDQDDDIDDLEENYDDQD